MRQTFKISLLLATLGLFSNKAISQISFNEPCTGTTANSLIIGGSAYLTAANSIDPVGSGYLRLTDATANQAGYAYFNQAFPSTTGFVAEFELACWGKTSGTPADGISLFLFDGSYGPGTFTIGGYGGFLGYNGLSGGYVGVGFDEYGGFSSWGGGPGYVRESVSMHGAATDGYPYLTGTAVSNTPLGIPWFDYGYAATRPAQSAYFLKGRVAIIYNSPLGKYQVSVSMQASLNGPMVQVIAPYTINTPPPATLKIGVAASTGSFTDIHEIRNVVVSSPAQLRVVKTGTTTVSPGGTVTYNVNVYNEDVTDISGVNFTDLLPANFSPSGNPVFTPVTAGNALTAGSYNGSQYNGTLTLKANSYSTFTFTGTANFTGNTDDSLNTTAYVTAPTGFIDANQNDDTSKVTTYRIPIAAAASETICGNTTPTGIPVADISNTKYTWTSVLTSGTVTGQANNAVAAPAINNTLANNGITPGVVTYTMTPVKTYQTQTGTQNATGTPVTYTVSVNPPPVVNSTIDVLAAAPNVTLTATVTGLVGSMQWRKNSINIAGATNNTYTIPDYRKAVDDAVYTLVANNAYNCPASAQVNLIAPLPLKLITFLGNRNNNVDNLTWTTTEEKDLHHFEVEHSTDGNNFTVIGVVNAATEVTLTHNYSFAYSTGSVAYYRLKMVDNNDKFSYSNVVKLNGEGNNTATAPEIAINQVTPVPFKDKLNVTVNTGTDIKGTISLIDLSGKTLVSISAFFQKGATVYTIDGLTQLTSGIYLIRVTTNEGHSATQKISK
ncbi:T9SS type A sorting domain-containing protein [Taibaiella soli]|uniref:Uncharacterized protein n=1 Tax=Taibaiella soli TaxID=1649169 RepID=A0A2W2BEI6_9BACT|nr:T9SS type A sorting domain-containing protein [Taibaiella soli]PZF72006.1 hypothetical protein DN068_15335 [Taibaiella soli]